MFQNGCWNARLDSTFKASGIGPVDDDIYDIEVDPSLITGVYQGLQIAAVAGNQYA
jgi:hypothetical protein